MKGHQAGRAYSATGKFLGDLFWTRVPAGRGKQEKDPTMGVLKALKDLDVKQALYMLNQSIHLMGVIVEKLDEISMKLDRRREEDNDNEEGRDA